MTCHAAHAVVGARKQLELHAAISAGVGAGLILIVVASGCTGHSQQFPQEEPQHSGRSPVLGMYGSAVRAMAASCSILAADSGEQFCFVLSFSYYSLYRMTEVSVIYKKRRNILELFCITEYTVNF
jgi:hypothetical protein